MSAKITQLTPGQEQRLEQVYAEWLGIGCSAESGKGGGRCPNTLSTKSAQPSGECESAGLKRRLAWGPVGCQAGVETTPLRLTTDAQVSIVGRFWETESLH